MVVRTHCNGHEVIGLIVGAYNARRYFPKNMSAIELELDHLRIECDLSADFWNGEGEIHDPRLCAWLQTKQNSSKSNRTPIPLDMIPSGEKSFKIGPVSARPTKESHTGISIVARDAA